MTHGYTGHEMVESVGVTHVDCQINDSPPAKFAQA